VTGRTLGIDLGTSGVRAFVLGGAASVAAAPLGPADRRDPAALWTAVASVLEQLDLAGVGAMAVAGTSGTLLPVHADGTPAAGLSLYSDPVPTPARARQLLGLPGAVRVLHEADWIAGQLHGRFDTTDWNNALKTGFDPLAQAWTGWEKTDVSAGRLPRVLAPGTAVGRVQPALAAQFGLPATAVVAAGTTDGCASFLATGADRVGDGVTALGSTTTLKLLSDATVTAPDHGIYSHRLPNGLLPGGWLPGGASNAGGAVLAQFFDPGQLTALSQRIDPARPSPCGFYPLPSPGERFPVNDPTLQPRLHPRPADDADFLHGLLEGLARIEALGYHRLAQCGAPPVRRVLTTGGGSGNPAWTAIRARVLGVPVEAAGADAARGAAVLARSALYANLH